MLRLLAVGAPSIGGGGKLRRCRAGFRERLGNIDMLT